MNLMKDSGESSIRLLRPVWRYCAPAAPRQGVVYEIPLEGPGDEGVYVTVRGDSSGCDNVYATYQEAQEGLYTTYDDVASLGPVAVTRLDDNNLPRYGFAAAGHPLSND